MASSSNWQKLILSATREAPRKTTVTAAAKPDLDCRAERLQYERRPATTFQDMVVKVLADELQRPSRNLLACRTFRRDFLVGHENLDEAALR